MPEKAVMISIRSEWCSLISQGKKTVEVRKTRPKLETPFKCYIYCTKGMAKNKAYSFKTWSALGKVMGEFVCNKITTASVRLHDVSGWYVDCMHSLNGSMLSETDVLSYAPKEDAVIYGWHISDLKIYDKTKRLCEFSVSDNAAVQKCIHRQNVCQPEYVTNDCGWLKGSYICHKNGEPDWCTKCKTKPLKRPPQSWCYVEET